MSMEISGSYGQYKANYAERVQAEQGQIKEIQERKEEALDKNPIQDEYISSEKSATKPTGLYRLGQDENGNRKVFFDNPEKTEDADEKGQPKISSDTPEKSAEKCTANTDKVDREIEKLKEKKQQLEQQIRPAFGNEKKVRELEKKLARIESELSQKDNDTYRRQNAEIS
ncbi:MAG: hypothetical protein HFH73_06195 [Lachnospiraceae bacterium]|nr:hypothetical protein [Lachnospiraceae bacterium]